MCGNPDIDNGLLIEKTDVVHRFENVRINSA